MQKNTELAIQKQEQQRIQTLQTNLNTYQQEPIELDWAFDKPNDQPTSTEFQVQPLMPDHEKEVLKQQLAQRDQQLNQQIQQQSQYLLQLQKQYAQWLTQCGTNERRTVRKEGDSVTVESRTIEPTSEDAAMWAFIFFFGITLGLAYVLWQIISSPEGLAAVAIIVGGVIYIAKLIKESKAPTKELSK